MDLRLTDNIQKNVSKALLVPSFSEKYRPEAEKIAQLKELPQEPYPVSQDLLQHVASVSGLHFHELIVGSGLYFPPKEVKPQNPEFLAYMDKLRAEQQERDYNKMVSDVISSEDQKFNLGIKPDELKEVKSHIATIFNILFSMVAVYVGVYKVSKSIFSDIGLQVLLGLAGALFIGVVEVILYSKYAYFATSEKKKSNKKKKKIATL